jgi:hypothetical protein
MEDPFDFQRKLAGAADELVDRAQGQLDAAHGQAQARDARLVPLDADHFYDPQEQIILQKSGSSFTNLGHDKAYMGLAADKVEAQARADGYVPVKGGFFWHPALKHLYVKHGDRYVLYSLGPRP